MARFLPMRGIRYARTGDITELVCPPYDIIGESEREALLSRCADNIVAVELPIGNNRYAVAADRLQDMLASGVLTPEREPLYYLLQMCFSFEGRTYTLEGLIGRCELRPFSDGVVLPHENTFSKAKDDRLNLLKSCKANISPVYLLFRDEDCRVREVMKRALQSEPLCEAYLDGVLHRLYAADPADAPVIEAAFAEKTLYIADGHHRYETGLNYKNACIAEGRKIGPDDPESFILAAAMPLESESLIVCATHRVVLGQKPEAITFPDCFESRPVAPENAEAELRECYDRGETAFVFVEQDGCTLLTLKEQPSSDPLAALDVSVLHDRILAPCFGIDAAKAAGGGALHYTRDVSEALALVKNGTGCCAFLLNPTRVAQIAAVSDVGGRMPQKSTYFWPKLITGMVLNVLEA